MEKEFVNYNQALKLKELGFDKPCFGRYWIKEFQLRSPKDYNAPTEKIDSVSAPTFSQAFRWFRENYNWTIEIKQVTKSNWSYTLNNFPKEITYYGELHDTYEEAELACLDKLIEIVEAK